MVRLQDDPGSGWAFLAFGIYSGIIIAASAHLMTWRWMADTAHNAAIGLLAYLLYHHWDQAPDQGLGWYLALCTMAPSLVFLASIVYRTTRVRGN